MAPAFPSPNERRSSNPILFSSPTTELALVAANDELTRQFTVDLDTLKNIKSTFEVEMKKGLAARGQNLAMIPTYVVKRVNGTEKGTYYALDLGGTNMRVCQVTLTGDGKTNIEQSKYTVPEEYKQKEACHLFDFIADCVGKFLRQQGTVAGLTEEAVLGFTFSFPVLSTAIDAGLLTTWTKGFECPGAEGHDVVQLMQDAFRRKNLRIRIAALVNDTVGTLLAHAYRHPQTDVAVILGTGTNAAYYERMNQITKWTGGKTAEEMVVNTEWGAFDKERRVLPVTQYDAKADRESINPGQQIFEKMISGMYLGEIVRNVLIHLIDCRLLFGGTSSPKLNTQHGFDTSLMSRIELDQDDGVLSNTRDVIENVLELPFATSLEDRRSVRRIVHSVGLRAARLSSAALAALLDQRGFESECHVGIDGSLFELYPQFKAHMIETLVELFGPERAAKVHLGLARDGSGIGAALIALTNA